MTKLGVALVAVISCSSPPAPPPAKPAPPEPPAAPPSDPAAEAPAPPEDPYLWLEDVTSDKALAWAKERSKVAQAELEAVPGFTGTRDRILAMLDSKDKIPAVQRRGASYYNFWRDADNPKGVLRRTTLAQFKKAAPRWETVLDVDALAKAEHENWVYQSISCVYPKYDRCLVKLSRGGGDAGVVREFDVTTKKFVEGGFVLPEAKSRVSWVDRDTIYVGTDFGPGSLTTSGYPRIAKAWKRGTPLADATPVFEGKETDVSAGVVRVWDHKKAHDLAYRSLTAFTQEWSLIEPGGKLVRIEVPIDAEVSLWRDQLLVTLRTEWKIADKSWPAGALIATPLAGFLAGKRDFTMLFEPAPNRSLSSTAELATALVTSELEDVRTRLTVWKLVGKKWTKQPFPGVAPLGSTSLSSVDGTGETDDYWLRHTDFLTPSTLSLGTLGRPPVPLKKSPAFFDAAGLIVEQHFATSKDGTRVPYFQVSRKTLALDGKNPTLLYGYGGFEISMRPGYDAATGASWDEHGGVYVLANIRGGGEYGPTWHQAAVKHDRQRAYDDFIAIAEDLIARKVTSPAHLGIAGGSNGGLLTGVMLTQRPDLFGAVVSSVPLLDMKRYHKLLAGASWMGEYGDPENAEDWAALAKYSPYQNVRATTKYPRVLFTSSTRDDRVHPGHARKMVARMIEQGHDVLYYENTEGGHGGAADNAQRAYLQALEFAFLAKQLGLKLD